MRASDSRSDVRVKHTSEFMEATAALAPALGVDAASLVGRALHARRVREAATRVQAAWRGRRARHLRRIARLWLGANYGMMRDELGPTPRAFVQLALRGGRVTAVDTDAVLGVGAAGTPWIVVNGGWQDVD
jgi:hypothetical protein